MDRGVYGGGEEEEKVDGVESSRNGIQVYKNQDEYEEYDPMQEERKVSSTLSSSPQWMLKMDSLIDQIKVTMERSSYSKTESIKRITPPSTNGSVGGAVIREVEEI